MSAALSFETRLRLSAIARWGLSLVYAVAALSLARSGAELGPTPLVSLAWIGALLAYALARLAAQLYLISWSLPERGDQLRALGRFVCLGSLIGWFIGLGQVGFDNLGFGAYLGLVLGLGLFSGLFSLLPQRASVPAGPLPPEGDLNLEERPFQG